MKKGMKMMACVLALLVLSGCRKDNEHLELELDELTVEYGHDVDFMQYIKSDQFPLSGLEVEGFDSMLVGEQEVTLTAITESDNRSATLRVLVQDTNAPEIRVKKDFDPIVMQDEDFNILDYYEAIDAIDGEVELFVLSDTKTDAVGENQIRLEAIDSNGLVSNKTVSLEVVAKVESEEEPSTAPSQSETEKPSVQTPKPEVSQKPNPTPSPSPTPSPQPQNPSTPKPSTSKPVSTKYLFADGYDFNSGREACKAYVTSQLSKAEHKGYTGSCEPIQENNIWIGYKALFN